ncbi:hypothetical protein JZ751_011200 [Albula glossodonta]|uniref:Uncharacterized protein n=1 Tax=Albula glossodonta TaxID=121402 RepID=A0A8T2NYP1_9TELE|nr:hypothetical protein JZ751_011200 [Albula glossodonta]
MEIKGHGVGAETESDDREDLWTQSCRACSGGWGQGGGMVEGQDNDVDVSLVSLRLTDFWPSILLYGLLDWCGTARLSTDFEGADDLEPLKESGSSRPQRGEPTNSGRLFQKDETVVVIDNSALFFVFFLFVCFVCFVPISSLALPLDSSPP